VNTGAVFSCHVIIQMNHKHRKMLPDVLISLIIYQQQKNF